MNKKSLYKTIRNIGVGLFMLGMTYNYYQLHKCNKEEDKELKHKHLMKSYYGLIGTIGIGGSTFLFGQHKLNKLEREVE